MGLQDPATLFDGQRDTVYDLMAYTHYDDSLHTSGYSSAVVGYYNDPTCGKVTATYYTQIVNSRGLELDETCHIDSAVLSLSLSNLYPAVATSREEAKATNAAAFPGGPAGDGAAHGLGLLRLRHHRAER